LTDSEKRIILLTLPLQRYALKGIFEGAKSDNLSGERGQLVPKRSGTGSVSGLNGHMSPERASHFFPWRPQSDGHIILHDKSVQNILKATVKKELYYAMSSHLKRNRRNYRLLYIDYALNLLHT
jgi:hypothetical protein